MKNISETTISQEQRRAIAAINGSKFNLMLLTKLPMAFFLGVRVKTCTESIGKTTIPFWWLSQNPFKSVYFAAQCSAAELSTGMLVIAATGNNPKFSTLLLKVEAEYSRKAVSRIEFTCHDGQMIRDAVQRAKKTGEGITFTASSVGRQKDGSEVSRMKFTWSVKVRSGR